MHHHEAVREAGQSQQNDPSVNKAEQAHRNEQSSIALPIAIVFAALFVGGAIIYSGQGNVGSSVQSQPLHHQASQQEQVGSSQSSGCGI